MKSKTKEPAPFGIKTYSWLKYLATLGVTMFLIVPLLVILRATGSLGSENLNFDALIWSLEGVGFGFLLLYLGLRIWRFLTTSYETKPKEKLYFWIAVGFYFLSFLFSLVVAILASVFSKKLSDDNPYYRQVLLWTAVSLIILVLITNLIASILETFSRIGEQQFLAEEHERLLDEGLVSQSGIHRTTEAKKVLEKTKAKEEVEVVEIEDKDVLDDFFQNQEKQD